MKFLVITFAPTINTDGKYYSYAPYVREMDIWFENSDEIRICSPTKYSKGTLLLSAFKRNDIQVEEIPEISFVGLKNKVSSFFLSFWIAFKIFRCCLWADHIHLRAPGNVTLIGAVVQFFFPRKKKTAKYAGNWGENKGQPWSYRIQKLILRNTFLSRNMKVMVYGNWPGQSANVIPFFTATYRESERSIKVVKRIAPPINLVFVGTLTANKNPLRSIEVAQQLLRAGMDVKLELYGDGILRGDLEEYIVKENLSSSVFFMGNVTAEQIKVALMAAHMLIFLSNSEGWPKAVAEAMFWGCVPVVPPISCVPWMLDDGNRGILVNNDSLSEIVAKIITLASKENEYKRLSENGMNWSRQFTLEKFQNDILQFL